MIGGMNYLLKHEPVLTYDVDFWLEDTAANLSRAEAALAALHAEWGLTEEDWGPVAGRKPGWLSRQTLYCLTSPHGSIDIFRHVKGLESGWQEAQRSAEARKTAGNIDYAGLSDMDMLRCQLALDEGERKQDRIRRLRDSLGEQDG